MFGDNLILGIFPSPVLLDNGRHVATASADVRIEVSKNKAKVQMRCSKVSVHDALFNWTRDYEPASTYPSTTGCDETMAVTSKENLSAIDKALSEWMSSFCQGLAKALNRPVGVITYVDREIISK